MRVLIIGAGPTGLGAAYRLQELGHDDYLVCDRNPYVGGLATSFHDPEGFTWDFAVHVAHSHYHYFDRLMEKILPDGFLHHERRSWVRAYGCWIPYPFQNNIRHLPPDALWECVEGLLDRGTLGPWDHETMGPQDFEGWILRNFGAGIAKHFMVPYNRKIWSIDPSAMNSHWLGDRVPTVDLKRILRNIALGEDDVAWGPNHTFQFPKAGGTGAIWEALAAELPAEKLRLSCELKHLNVHDKTATFADGTIESYDHLVSTIPLVRLAELTGIDPLIERSRGLKYTHVRVVGVAPRFKIPDELSEKTWVYCPEDRTVFYRVTPFSIFSPAHVPAPENHCSFLCEISTPGDQEPLPEAEAVERTLRDLRESGLVEATEDNTHLYNMYAEFGYPVPTLDRDDILNEVLPALEQQGIFSRGRFGGWKYEVANMDHSLMQGVEAVNRILLGEQEMTLWEPNLVNRGKW